MLTPTSIVFRIVGALSKTKLPFDRSGYGGDSRQSDAIRPRKISHLILEAEEVSCIHSIAFACQSNSTGMPNSSMEQQPANGSFADTQRHGNVHGKSTISSCEEASRRYGTDARSASDAFNQSIFFRDESIKSNKPITTLPWATKNPIRSGLLFEHSIFLAKRRLTPAVLVWGLSFAVPMENFMFEQLNQKPKRFASVRTELPSGL